MKMKLLGVAAVLGCITMMDAGAGTGRSSMYSSIDMRNSNGDVIRVNRGISAGQYGNRMGRSGMYGDMGRNSGATHRYQRVEPVQQNAEPVEQSVTQESEYATKRTYTHGETYTKKTARRKYFIANPFYQPLQFQFGSVTTGEYMEGSYKFVDVKRKLTELSIKEDLSFGITDRIAVQAMAKYNNDKLTWKNSLGDTDKYKSDGLNVYGIGLQGRIVDTNEWIATISGYYEHQKHGIDYYIADIKAGYKVSTSTIYGVLRGWIINMEGDLYGDYIENHDTNEWGMMVYGDNSNSLLMKELGAGVWTVLDEDWTLNVEGMYGWYDWHDQFSIKGAFGWQPNDLFALNLYVKTSLYDTANGKKLYVHSGTLPLTQASWNSGLMGEVKLSKYQEWSAGLQVMFQF